MSEIIAKVGKEFKNVLNQEDNIIDDIEIEISETFSPSYKLDENEWYKFENFSQQNFFIDECKSDFSTANLNQIENNEYDKIVCVSIFQNNRKYFYRITPSLYINKKTILDYSGEPKIVEHKKQIEIKNEPDAIYCQKEDVLYFKHIGKLKIIFSGIEILHREATQEEVNRFVNNNFINLDGIQSNYIGEMNRKRIADIGNKFNNLSQEKKELLIEYAKNNANIELIDDKFNIKNENDLKNLLFALDQRYYFADIYEEKRVANSIKIVN